MVTPGRSFAAGDGYRFGFNGMESQGIDCGCDGVYTSYFRQYDQRIGRWWSIDPKYKVYHGLTPYANNLNNPIKLYDPLGDCPPLNVGCQIVKKVYKRIAKTETQTKKYVEKKNEINNPYKNPDYSYKPEVREEQNANVDAQAKSYVVKESGRVLEGTFTVIGNVPGMETASDAILATYNYIQGDNEEALAYAAGLVLPGLSGTQLEKIKIAAPHLHHIFTNKNFIRGQQWSKKFEPLFDQAGYKLSDKINTVLVSGHKGPHPDAYHQLVYDELITATKGLTDAEYKKAFDSTLERLSKEASTAGTKANKLITGN